MIFSTEIEIEIEFFYSLLISIDFWSVPDCNMTPDVEDLVLHLFELVNEKNELFRRQAELMYL